MDILAAGANGIPPASTILSTSVQHGQGFKGKADTAKSDFDKADGDYKSVQQVGGELANIGDRRMAWAELLKAINECLPKDAAPTPDDITKRNIILR